MDLDQQSCCNKIVRRELATVNIHKDSLLVLGRDKQTIEHYIIFMQPRRALQASEQGNPGNKSLGQIGANVIDTLLECKQQYGKAPHDL